MVASWPSEDTTQRMYVRQLLFMYGNVLTTSGAISAATVSYTCLTQAGIYMFCNIMYGSCMDVCLTWETVCTYVYMYVCVYVCMHSVHIVYT